MLWEVRQVKRVFYKENAVYQIYPRSFCDSNGDGIGDIVGIISKLDYLKNLGIGIIWLSPIYVSPNDDMGYDVADYQDINPEYGNLQDMDNLIAEAKKRGIRIIMDLVINHTSSEHQWFKSSKDVNSKYHNYYIWKKGKCNNKKPPNNWQSMFSGPAWKFDSEVNEWYLHLYGEKQPDLNWHNSEVKEEVKKILRFWLDRGIYGFRCDVINQIYKTTLKDGKPRVMQTGKEHYLNQPGNHEILKELNSEVFSKYDCMTVGETYAVTYEAAKKFTDNELTMVFQFDHVNVDKGFVPLINKKYRPSKLKKIFIGWQKNIEWNANYLENHDQLRSIERFGDAGEYYLESAKMLALLIGTLKGTTYIYEGQEIGMLNHKVTSVDQIKDVSVLMVNNILTKLHIPPKTKMRMLNNFNRDNARTPMQWNDSENAGFSSGVPWLSVNPNYVKINAKAEVGVENSIFSFYKLLLATKKENLTLCYGNIDFYKTHGDLFMFNRLDENNEFLVCLNLGKKNQRLPFQLHGKLILSNYETKDYKNRDYLSPFEAVILKTK